MRVIKDDFYNEMPNSFHEGRNDAESNSFKEPQFSAIDTPEGSKRFSARYYVTGWLDFYGIDCDSFIPNNGLSLSYSVDDKDPDRIIGSIFVRNRYIDHNRSKVEKKLVWDQNEPTEIVKFSGSLKDGQYQLSFFPDVIAPSYSDITISEKSSGGATVEETLVNYASSCKIPAPTKQ